MSFNFDYLCTFSPFITHGNRFDGERGCLGNYMRQHCRVFQRVVVLGKLVHTPSFGAFEFLRASYHWR